MLPCSIQEQLLNPSLNGLKVIYLVICYSYFHGLTSLGCRLLLNNFIVTAREIRLWNLVKLNESGKMYRLKFMNMGRIY